MRRGGRQSLRNKTWADLFEFLLSTFLPSFNLVSFLSPHSSFLSSNPENVKRTETRLMIFLRVSSSLLSPSLWLERARITAQRPACLSQKRGWKKGWKHGEPTFRERERRRRGHFEPTSLILLKSAKKSLTESRMPLSFSFSLLVPQLSLHPTPSIFFFSFHLRLIIYVPKSERIEERRKDEPGIRWERRSSSLPAEHWMTDDVFYKIYSVLEW